MSTSLIGPYDAIPTYDKTRIMCGVPTELVKEMFTEHFTSRGVQDKILARLFHIFYLELDSPASRAALDACVTVSDKEKLINDLLNKLAYLQALYEQATLADLTVKDES